MLISNKKNAYWYALIATFFFKSYFIELLKI